MNIFDSKRGLGKICLMTVLRFFREWSTKFVVSVVICFYCVINGAAAAPQSVGRVTAKISNNNGGNNKPTSQSLFKYYFGADLSTKLVTPCTFPTPNERDLWHKSCSIEPETARKYNICDPESSTYFSNMDPLLKTLDDVQTKHSDQCVCSNASGPKCWYKFAFAFLDQLRHPALPLNDIDINELCNPNVTNDLPPLKTSQSTWESRQAINAYGNRFAELLRKRWRAGSCGEDILILIVKHAPEVLNSNKNGGSKPAFFISYGETVRSRTQHITKPQNFQIKSMMEAVQLANDMLQGHGENSTLEKALVILVSWYDQLLTLADQTYHKYNPKGKGAKSHIPPNWALGAFAGCAVLLVVMGVGSCLVRTRVRRGGMRSKAGGDPNRRWKAGFVGGMFLRHGAQDNAAGRMGESDVRNQHRPSTADMTYMS